MAKLSPVVSLYNLNQVYTELDNRINSLNKIWDVQGTCTWSTLKGKIGTTVGEVWNVSDTDDWGINGGNWTWTTTEPDSSINSIKVGSGWWERLGSILEYASPDTAGVAKVYSFNSGNSAANTSSETIPINRGVYTVDNTLYTTIPVATTSTYGVVTNQDGQTFGGEKTFNNGIIVNGTISTPAGSTAAMVVTGNTVAGTVNVGNLSVTNTLDVIGNDTSDRKAAQSDLLTVHNNNSTALTTVSENVITKYLDVINTLKVTKAATTPAFSAQTDTLTVNNNLLVAGSNLNTNQWSALGVTASTAAAAVINNLNVSNAANINTLSMSNKTLTVNNDTIVNTLTIPDGTIITSEANVGSLTLNTIDNDTLTVKTNTTVNTLSIASGTIIANSANVGTLTLSTTNNNTLTVNTNTTVNTLNITSGGSITADSAVVGDLIVTGNATTQTLSGANETAVPAIIIASGGTVTVENLTLNNGSTDQNLIVQNDIIASTLDASNSTIEVTGSGAAVTLGTLTAGIAGSGDDSNFLQVGDTDCSIEEGTESINKVNVPTREVDDDDHGFYNSKARLKVYGGIRASGGIQATKVFNAVWNDLSDLIEIDCQPEPGYAYSFDGEHYHKTTKYMDQGYIGIESDTSGFEMGGKGAKYELNASVAGFVLVYVDKEYKPGTPLTVTKDGKLTKIGLLGRLFHPEMIIATFWKKEPQKFWGKEGAKREVNGRMWVRIK